jgi:orotidine-5'-phosphate decarboxylase
MTQPGPTQLDTALRDRLCLALDLDDRDAILAAVDELTDLVGWVKLNSAFTLFGPALVEEILQRDVKVFLDLKLHDIPNTLAGYAGAVTRLGVHLVTLHTAGGLEMLRTAVSAADKAAAELGGERPKLVGVTLLTSVDDRVLRDDLNIASTVEEEILRRGQLAAEAGLDGIVCAPGEVARVREQLPRDFFYVTPGTRTSDGSAHDHLRTGTPAAALAGGASLLVLGRRVFDAPDRRAALLDVHRELEQVR